jgi:hypothetical protein
VQDVASPSEPVIQLTLPQFSSLVSYLLSNGYTDELHGFLSESFTLAAFPQLALMKENQNSYLNLLHTITGGSKNNLNALSSHAELVVDVDESAGPIKSANLKSSTWIPQTEAEMLKLLSACVFGETEFDTASSPSSKSRSSSFSSAQHQTFVAQVSTDTSEEQELAELADESVEIVSPDSVNDDPKLPMQQPVICPISDKFLKKLHEFLAAREKTDKNLAISVKLARQILFDDSEFDGDDRQMKRNLSVLGADVAAKLSPEKSGKKSDDATPAQKSSPAFLLKHLPLRRYRYHTLRDFLLAFFQREWREAQTKSIEV